MGCARGPPHPRYRGAGRRRSPRRTRAGSGPGLRVRGVHGGPGAAPEVLGAVSVADRGGEPLPPCRHPLMCRTRVKRVLRGRDALVPLPRSPRARASPRIPRRHDRFTGRSPGRFRRIRSALVLSALGQERQQVLPADDPGRLALDDDRRVGRTDSGSSSEARFFLSSHDGGWSGLAIGQLRRVRCVPRRTPYSNSRRYRTTSTHPQATGCTHTGVPLTLRHFALGAVWWDVIAAKATI